MKKIIATTAVSLMLSTAAIAQSANGDVQIYQAQDTSDVFASEYIGSRVYSAQTQFDSFNDETRVQAGAETEWDDIGEINDVVFSRAGEVQAVVIGVGGFLGIGEKDVAINMDSIKIVREQDDVDDFYLVVNTTQEVLENAPDFETLADQQAAQDMAANQVATPGAQDNVAVNDPAATPAAPAADGANQDMAAGDDATMEEGTDDMAASETAEPSTEMAEGEMAQEFETIDTAGLTAEDLQGASVFNANDENLGEVDSLLMGDSQELQEAILDIGGFMGVNEHRIAVSMDQIEVRQNADGEEVRVYVNASEEELKAMPEYEG